MGHVPLNDTWASYLPSSSKTLPCEKMKCGSLVIGSFFFFIFFYQNLNSFPQSLTVSTCNESTMKHIFILFKNHDVLKMNFVNLWHVLTVPWTMHANGCEVIESLLLCCIFVQSAYSYVSKTYFYLYQVFRNTFFVFWIIRTPLSSEKYPTSPLNNDEVVVEAYIELIVAC